ncbi:polyketide synthase [Micromonospora tulbaghiae]|uniref:Polyketide synthase n=1 Tax=Micromonospora tulbaghiae TaxID=479978 RepID=A0A386WU03_9ACTN|nr:type I polyketide synthase [Micromonospora tulbaghiae]AYF31956.1 polyketide synthase [Micromonospora tulbaghiae]
MSEEAKLRDYLKRAIADSRRARARLLEAEEQAREPIAIIGMACRYPLGIGSPEALWAAVAAGTDAISPYPANRGWRDEQFEPGATATASSRTREGAFLTDPGDFDAAFFGISPREALSMDPQQRQLLETSWEALERAGIKPESLHGSATGVYVGGITQEYPALLAATGLDREGYALTGTTSSVMSGRVAYALGLEGPAVTVDTACSSSLVAIHLAIHALRAGECGLALASGVNLMATPQFFVAFSGQGGVAPDGRCKSFAAAADGIGFGEGVGVLVLERLSDAHRNGHRVLAVLRGSAVNSDGASNGLTAPNGPAQQRVIRRALASARLEPGDVDAVEAHGTGTRLGDPIEAQAILATYGRGRRDGHPLWLGSAKSNFGHTQAAAGLTGVIKMVMALQHELLPRTLHVDAPTPHVDWSAAPVRLLTEAQPWPATDRPRRAGVSSFGISGTNAHLILEEAPPAPERDPGPEARVTPPGDQLPWILSGRTVAALQAQAQRLTDHLVERPGLSPAGIARSLAGTRSAFRHRAVLLGEPPEQIAALGALARGEAAAAAVTGVANAGRRVVLVFPGQGGQWPGMGTGLLDSAPVFADRMRDCSAALAPYLDYSPEAVLRGEPGAPSLDRVDVTQVVNFALMVSLAALWRSHGIEPAAVIGHSQGEVAAACVAGALSLEDAARVIAVRGREALRLDGAGGLLSVWLSAGEAEELIEPWGDRLTVGAVNGPHTVIVSGENAALDELAETCAVRGIRARRVAMRYASHSRYVESIRDDLSRALGEVPATPAPVAFYSTVTGALFGTDGLDAAYWYRNLREPVRMHDAVRAALDDECDMFIEVSPHPVLVGAVQDTIADRSSATVALGTLRRKEPETARMLRSLAEAYVSGAPVDWRGLLGAAPELPVELPTYAFQHQRFWVEPPGVTMAAEDSEFWEAVGSDDPDVLAATIGLGDAGEQVSLRDVAPALARFHRRRQQESVVDSWRYRVIWRRAEVAPAVPGGTWLVVTAGGDAGPEPAAVERALTLAGVTVLRLDLQHGTDRGTVATRVREITDRHGELAGVLSYAGLDHRTDLAHAPLTAGAVATIVLVQGLLDAGVEARLWLVTRGAEQVVPADRPSADAAALAGLARIAGLEHPATWGGVVDLPGAAARPDADAAVLCGLLAGAADDRGEDQFALRAGGVFVRRLARASRPHSTTDGWRPRGTVLITGGTGGVGTEVARWLAASGAEHLVLVSRSGATAEGAEALRNELGVPVTLLACDMADRDAVATMLAAIPAEPRLTAVVHAAGVGAQQTLTELTPAKAARVAAGKAAGARHLDELLGDRPLDAFVLFSSAAAVWGSAGMAAYAAANAYLDGLAAERRARGRAGTSIAWGGWAGAGMGRLVADDAHTRQGVRMMPPALALTALRRAVEQRDVTVTVADVDWPRFAEIFSLSRRRPLLDEVAEAASAAAEPADDSRAAELGRRLARGTEPERDEIMRNLVRTEAAAVLGYAGNEQLPVDVSFKDLGFTSVTAVELRQRLASATGLNLPATLVFDHPSVDAVTALLRRRITGELTETTPATPVTTADDGDPVVIVGMACRYPGGVTDPESLWALLASGADAVGPFPTDRGWTGATDGYVPEGGFLYDAACFDHGFFGISPREAQAMDPQQRLLLETSWEAIEHAGIDPARLRGSATGVFVGAGPSDYSALLGAARGGAEGFAMTGTAGSIVSGRISYVLGLEGPAITVDTGCSSSLVTVHLAAQSLRNAECDLAVAGGVAVMATPVAFTEFARQGGLAADARCKSFAGAADGTGWSEGVGLVVLERLSAARRNGHRVLAVLRGSAVNSDGASNGLTAPNGPSQERVIRAALASAGLEPADVGAVEAHGTGTALGDPIEAQALLVTYGRGRPEERPLWLGSIKSNIGHTQAAAGVAGIIKIVLALRHELLPRTLHVDEPTPHADWSAGAVRLLTEARPWPRGDRPRRAGISSFGISGTNAHLVVEEAPPEPAPAPRTPSRPLPVVVTARTPEALAEQAARLGAWLAARPGLSCSDAAYSLMTTRTSFDHRAVVTADDRNGVLLGLAALAEGRAAPGVYVNRVRRDGKVVFVFPGQGAQWAGMAASLWAVSPVFAEAMAECEAALGPFVDWSLREVVHDTVGAPPLERVDVVQPVLFAVMVSLARLWESCGVRPSAVVGHSQGEIAAAVVAGALSLADGARVVALRSRALRALAGTGGMATVDLPLDEVESLLERWDGRLSVAAVNGPRSVVVSGEATALQDLLAHCTGADVRARRIAVDYASHSGQVEGIRDEITGALAGVAPRPAAIPFYSTLTGSVLSGEELDAEYWYQNLRRPVRLRQVVELLDEDGFRVFVECSPHPVLAVGVQDTLHGRDSAAVLLGTLRRDDGGLDRFRASLAEAHLHGVEVDWPAALGDVEVAPVELPTYPFQHTRHWLDGPARATDVTAAGLTDPAHPLLAAGVEVADSGAVVFTARLSRAATPWLGDHVVAGVAVLPATALAEMVAKGGEVVGLGQVDELTLHAPVLVPAEGAVDLQLTVGPEDEGGRRPVRLHSRSGEPGEAWQVHGSGWLSPAHPEPPSGDLTAWPPVGAEPVSVDGLYGALAEAGVDLGPAFHGLRAAWTTADALYAEVSLADGMAGDASGHLIHPALLDAALQGIALGDLLPGGAAGHRPFSFTDLAFYRPVTGTVRVRMTAAGPDSVAVLLADETGGPVCSIGSLVLRAAPVDEVRAGVAGTHDGLFRIDWVPAPPSAPASASLALVGPDPLPAGLNGELRRFPGLAELRQVVDAGEPVPDLVLVAGVPAELDADTGLAARTRAATRHVLELIRAWTTDERLAHSRLAVVTRGAVATGRQEDVSDPAAAAVWGLLRSAHAEHPERFLVTDVDDREASARALVTALAGAEEQSALRDGRLLVPRLARLPRDEPGAAPGATFDPDGTVLVTGATGGVGSLVAEHLVTAHGVRHLLLVSRSGSAAPGADLLVERLRALGAEITVAACDVGDAAALSRLVRQAEADRPLAAVVHSAGVFDDGLLTVLTDKQVDTVYRAKVDAAAHLHELTRDRPSVPLVLFSSSAGVFGGAGQANYAAANAFLDGLAQHRRSRGLPGVALAWGLWADERGMGGQIDEAQRQRHARRGIAAMPAEDALALFDAACRASEAALLPMRLDWPALYAKARVTGVPPLLRNLVRVARRRTGTDRQELQRRLGGMGEHERTGALVDLVRELVAGVLGYESASAVDQERPFRDLGFDSLTAVELRNLLNAATGLRLPVTVVFDHPQPLMLAERLASELFAGSGPEMPVGDPEEERIRRLVAAVPISRLRNAGLLDALLALGDPAAEQERPAGRRAEIEAMDADALVRMAMVEDSRR